MRATVSGTHAQTWLGALTVDVQLRRRAPTTDRYAVAYATRSAGALVTAVTGETQAVINRLVTEATRAGTPGRELAHQLRQHIGLNFTIIAQHVSDNVDFVVEAFGE